MSDFDRTSDRGDDAIDLERKVDIIAGALVDLEMKVSQMAAEVTGLGPKLNELLDRHPAGLGAAADMTAAVTSDVTSEALGPVHASLASLTSAAGAHRDDLLLALDVLTRVAEAIERLDDRTEDRMAAVRDATIAPTADLQELLAAHGERTDARLAELSGTLDALAEPPPEGPDPVLDRIDDLRGRLTEHTDTALAGTLRLLDERLNALQVSVTESLTSATQQHPQPSPAFEAGAVMGAAQAAWSRLEQRLDNEFDDLGRQLQAMSALIEQASATAEAAANRPVLTSEQLRHAASAVKDSVVNAGRARRDRRGGPRGLGPGSSSS